MNISLEQTTSTAILLSQVWDRVHSYTDRGSKFVNSLQQIGGSSFRGTSLSLLIEKVGQKATLIWSLIPFTFFTAAKFPFAAIQVGFSVKECLKTCDCEERIEKGLEMLESLGNLCFAGISSTVAICRYLGRCTPWLFPVGVAGGVFQLGGVAAGICGVIRDKRFAKELCEAEMVSQNEALMWMTKRNPRVLKQQFRLLNGDDLIQFAKELLEDPQATSYKDKLLTLLKGRLKNTIRGDMVKLAARVTGVAGLSLLFIAPSIGLILSGVSSTLQAVVPIRDAFEREG